MSETTWEIECDYGCMEPHVFSEDWIFGGANDSDPRADPRWLPTTYHYYDDRLNDIHATQVPLCDEEAIDRFTVVAGYSSRHNVKYIAALRPGATKPVMLPWEYDKITDTAKEVNRGG